MALDPTMPVLVVDDYSTMVRIIRNLLRQLGFADVDDASDGLQAIAKMHAKRYGLVISDWNMEPMTGFDLLRQVRADPDLGETPFIMITAEIKDRKRSRGTQGRRQQLHRQAVQRADAQEQNRSGVHQVRSGPRAHHPLRRSLANRVRQKLMRSMNFVSRVEHDPQRGPWSFLPWHYSETTRQPRPRSRSSSSHAFRMAPV